MQLTTLPSPFTAQTVALAGSSFGDMHSAAPAAGVYFSCTDPKQQGKSAIRCVAATTTTTATASETSSPSTVVDVVTDPMVNVRSAVHEYGGGSFCVGPHGDGVVYTVFPSHVVYWKKSTVAVSDEPPLQIFPAAGTTSPCRLADFSVAYDDKGSPLLLAVMENHTNPEPSLITNSIVGVMLDGMASFHTLAGGMDFYASPSQDIVSKRLSFVAWNHPNMPWDHTTLYVTADPILDTASSSPSSSSDRPSTIAVTASDELAQQQGHGVYAPQWFQGNLYFLSNVSGWYTLHKWNGADTTALYPIAADFCEAKCGWMLGCRCFAFLEAAKTLVAVYSPSPASTNSKESQVESSSTGSRVILMHTETGAIQEFGRSCLPPTSIDTLTTCSSTGTLYFFGGSTTTPRELWCWERPGDASCVAHRVFSPQVEHLSLLQESFMSTPRQIRFPSPGGIGYAYGYYYPPSTANAMPDVLPPLLVKAHGGPTACTSTTFRLDIQYWTSRGFSVLDVDYGGSTGYGKLFQKSLEGNWGVVDVSDVCNGAQYCVEQGWVNPEWLCIDGRSAGGYTTLAALVFKDTFRAGASLYGIGDLAALAEDTHKFESRYLDSLIGPYPAKKEVYEERCPINFIEKLNCPVILLQGEEDKVVPPNQAEKMYQVLTAKGLSSTLVLYKGEQHGFRKPENVRHALSSEYFFFCTVFGLVPQSEEGFDGIKIGSRVVI
jgi:dienelactone hydrolase